MAEKRGSRCGNAQPSRPLAGEPKVSRAHRSVPHISTAVKTAIFIASAMLMVGGFTMVGAVTLACGTYLRYRPSSSLKKSQASNAIPRDDIQAAYENRRSRRGLRS